MYLLVNIFNGIPYLTTMSFTVIYLQFLLQRACLFYSYHVSTSNLSKIKKTFTLCISKAFTNITSRDAVITNRGRGGCSKGGDRGIG